MVFVISCTDDKKSYSQQGKGKLDSISNLVFQSKNLYTSSEERIELMFRAYQFCSNIKNDSIRLKGLLKLSYESLQLSDTSFFKMVNKESSLLAIELKDTFSLSDTYWNLGVYNVNKLVLDSAFFYYRRAYEGFESINHSYYSGRLLYNMAVIQKDVKDYTGSEILTFQAIQKFEDLDRPLNLYLCYNLLGVLFNEMKEYEKAEFYHKKSLEYLDEVENKKTYREGSYNNLGLVYRNLNQYGQSILMYEKALANENVKKENPFLYARLLDNLAYTKLLNKDLSDLSPIFNNALKIRDSLNNYFGSSISKYHMAAYASARGDTAQAILLAKESNKLASQVDNNKIVLQSLKFLSEVDKENGSTYLQEFIALNEALQNRERKQRNKFTRIRFETDQYIEETERLDSEKKLIITGSVFLILLLSLMYFIKRQSNKNKELLFEKKQQKANEEIYSLMLRQQVRLEEGKLKERNRIAEELHDGVLGRIFGTRMGLGFLNLKGDDKKLREFKKLKKDLQLIEEEIRDISHELRTDDFSNQFNFLILVEDLLKDQSKIGCFKYVIKSDDNIEWAAINENIKINCYRILQEAIYNVTKHANAISILVEFKLEKQFFQLIVKDDGVGFEIKGKRNGIGLKNIKMRSRNMKAKFSLKTKLTNGTTIIVTIPI